MRIFFLSSMVLISVLFTGIPPVCGQNDTTTYPPWVIPPAKNYFGISLTPSQYEIVTYAIITINSKGEKTIIILSKQSFFLQITGRQSSKANKELKDLILENGILSPATIGDFWKLRYGEYPYRSQGNPIGWGKTKNFPSDGQWQVLKGYGIENIDSFCYGDNLFRLLKNMEDINWISDYTAK